MGLHEKMEDEARYPMDFISGKASTSTVEPNRLHSKGFSLPPFPLEPGIPISNWSDVRESKVLFKTALGQGKHINFYIPISNLALLFGFVSQGGRQVL